MAHFTQLDGGQIGIRGDRAEASAWYCRHLGLRILWDSPDEGQTLLGFPEGSAIPLVSTRGGSAVSVWPNDGEPLHASAVRLCLAAPDLAATHAALADEGIPVTPITPGPGGTPYFDFYDLEGTRLTAVSTPDEGNATSTGRIAGYASPRIGVRDLPAAIAWYTEHLGAREDTRDATRGAARFVLGDDHYFWLETVDATETRHGPTYARLYLFAPDLDAAHRFCSERNLAPSPITGLPHALRVFSFRDPDGNVLNAWSYPPADG